MTKLAYFLFISTASAFINLDFNAAGCTAREKSKVEQCIHPFIQKLGETRNSIATSEITKEQGTEIVDVCRESQDCFKTVGCSRQLEAEKKARVFCDAGEFLFSDYFECMKKLKQSKSECISSVKLVDILKAKGESGCNAFRTLTRCFKKETLRVCTDVEWRGMRAHIGRFAQLINADCDLRAVL